MLGQHTRVLWLNANRNLFGRSRSKTGSARRVFEPSRPRREQTRDRDPSRADKQPSPGPYSFPNGDSHETGPANNFHELPHFWFLLAPLPAPAPESLLERMSPGYHE